jgi:hypothetical protein
MVKPHRLLWGAWVKWQVLDYLGMKRTKRLKHLIVTDETSLQYWENIYRIKQQP